MDDYAVHRADGDAEDGIITKTKLFLFFILTIIHLPICFADVYLECPTETINQQISTNSVNVAIIYIYSSKLPTIQNGWEMDWKDVVRGCLTVDFFDHDWDKVSFGGDSVGISVEGYFRKYVQYQWQWNFYEFYVPEYTEHPYIFSPVKAKEALPLWRAKYPSESREILTNADVVWIYVNSRFGAGISKGTIWCSAIAEGGGDFDPTRQFPNQPRYVLLNQIRFTFGHEITHLFGALDHYTPSNVEPKTDCIMGDSNGIFGDSFRQREMPYIDDYLLTNEIHWNYVKKQNFAKPSEIVTVHFYVSGEYGPLTEAMVTVSTVVGFTDSRGHIMFFAEKGESYEYSVDFMGYPSMKGVLAFDESKRIDINLQTQDVDEDPLPPTSFDPIILVVISGLLVILIIKRRME